MLHHFRRSCDDKKYGQTDRWLDEQVDFYTPPIALDESFSKNILVSMNMICNWTGKTHKGQFILMKSVVPLYMFMMDLFKYW